MTSVGLSLPASTTSPIDGLGCLAVTSPSLFFPGYSGQSTAPPSWRTGYRLADQRRFMASAHLSSHCYWPSDSDSLTASQPAPVAPQQPRGYLRPLTNHSSRPCFARRLNSGVRPAMTPMHRFAVLVLIGISTSACSAQQSIPACPSGLQPLTSVPPILPAKLHNDFEGSVVISFVIDRDGRVQSPVVASSAWQPMGRTSPSKSGHNDVVLSAIQQWRYPSQPRPCRHQAPFEFKFDSSLTSLRGRSNNSFKPTLLRKAA